MSAFALHADKRVYCLLFVFHQSAAFFVSRITAAVPGAGLAGQGRFINIAGFEAQ